MEQIRKERRRNYDKLNLPDPFHLAYVLECEVNIANPITIKEVCIHFPLIEEAFIENNIWVQT